MSKIAVFAHKNIGKKTLEFLLDNYKDDIKAVVLVNESSEIYTHVITHHQNFNQPVLFNDDLKNDITIHNLKQLNLDFIILAWWPFIIKEPVLSLPSIGILNFHPSYLPYNRGRNYNFWNIIEDTPFGVTIHFIDNSIDGGDIVFQQKIEKNWCDTGESLYYKAEQGMIDLFMKSYPAVREGKYERKKQDLTKGSFHLGKELEPASEIDLKKNYSGEELLNILRARTFPPYPGAWFISNGEKYEARISINKAVNKSS